MREILLLLVLGAGMEGERLARRKHDAAAPAARHGRGTSRRRHGVEVGSSSSSSGSVRYRADPVVVSKCGAGSRVGAWTPISRRGSGIERAITSAVPIACLVVADLDADRPVRLARTGFLRPFQGARSAVQMRPGWRRRSPHVSRPVRISLLLHSKKATEDDHSLSMDNPVSCRRKSPITTCREIGLGKQNHDITALLVLVSSPRRGRRRLKLDEECVQLICSHHGIKREMHGSRRQRAQMIIP
jgi:hypothetical protein